MNHSGFLKCNFSLLQNDFYFSRVIIRIGFILLFQYTNSLFPRLVAIPKTRGRFISSDTVFGIIAYR